MNAATKKHDRRLEELRSWLAESGSTTGEIAPAAADASFRRYFRLRPETGPTRIVMDAPPERESLASWLHVSSLLSRAGVHVPKIERVDAERGFVVMEDLGDDSYARVHDRHDPLWEKCVNAALETLVRMQNEIPAEGLSIYDETLLANEMNLFTVWLIERHLELDGARVRTLLAPLARRLIDDALSTPYRFVHRDYHSRNLLAGPPPLPGVVDFQDAVWGPVTYDLVSLFKDCYIDWPREAQKTWVTTYHGSCPTPVRRSLDPESLLFRFDLMGVQRHLKAAGIFARLCWRDGKVSYLDSIPQTLGYIVQAADERPLLQGLTSFLEESVFPHLEAARARALEVAPCMP
jgi:aminoglycoside/choline kinase family phosphotransferase